MSVSSHVLGADMEIVESDQIKVYLSRARALTVKCLLTGSNQQCNFYLFIYFLNNKVYKLRNKNNSKKILDLCKISGKSFVKTEKSYGPRQLP